MSVESNNIIPPTYNELDAYVDKNFPHFTIYIVLNKQQAKYEDLCRENKEINPTEYILVM